MKWLRNVWVHRLLGVVLGGIFLYAAKDKLLDPRAPCPRVFDLWVRPSRCFIHQMSYDSVGRGVTI